VPRVAKRVTKRVALPAVTQLRPGMNLQGSARLADQYRSTG